MKLAIFGAGYVGLVTGTGLADLGHDVLVLDVDATKISLLSKGEIPIYEPGLADLVKRNIQNKRLHFSCEIPGQFGDADAYFIAVGTPAKEDGSADITQVYTAASQIAKHAKRNALVVMKSTVPVGTCDAVQSHIDGSKDPKVELEVVSNPEFLKEGAALGDFFRPERIVLGARTEKAQNLMRALYAPLQLSGERVVVTDLRSSELIKYASNAMLAMRVSFMNELARLCHASGADIHSVRLGVGSDSRIGRRFLYAGPGYGGSCFPKDVQALVSLGRAHGVPMRLAEATHLSNEEQGQFLATLVERSMGQIRGKRIAFWGLSFKPETDDVRDAPSVKLAKILVKKGAYVVGHDPEAGANFLHSFVEYKDLISVVENEYDAIEQAHALVLLTEWRVYRAPNFDLVRRKLLDQMGVLAPVIDARNIWRPGDVIKANLRYQGIGVPLGSSAFISAGSSRALL